MARLHADFTPISVTAISERTFLSTKGSEVLVLLREPLVV